MDYDACRVLVVYNQGAPVNNRGCSDPAQLHQNQCMGWNGCAKALPGITGECLEGYLQAKGSPKRKLYDFLLFCLRWRKAAALPLDCSFWGLEGSKENIQEAGWASGLSITL